MEKLIPALEEINTEMIGFVYREDAEKWREFHRGNIIHDPIKTKRKLFTAKTENKACPINSLRNTKDEWKELLQKTVGD